MVVLLLPKLNSTNHYAGANVNDSAFGCPNVNSPPWLISTHHDGWIVLGPLNVSALLQRAGFLWAQGKHKESVVEIVVFLVNSVARPLSYLAPKDRTPERKP